MTAAPVEHAAINVTAASALSPPRRAASAKLQPSAKSADARRDRI